MIRIIVYLIVLVAGISRTYCLKSAYRRRKVKSGLYGQPSMTDFPYNYPVVTEYDQRSKMISYVISASTTLLLSPLLLNAADYSQNVSSVSAINLNEMEPEITDICWLDVKIGNEAPRRMDIGLYGNVVPKTVRNFKTLCENSLDWGYKNSMIFRIISEFSVQGGNIGSSKDAPLSSIGRDGKSALGYNFPPENFLIGHDFRDAGVISMMKDVRTGLQDSRFFITTKPVASWADGKYVAFGRITSGLDVLTALTVIPVEPPSNYPKTTVKIVGSGVYASN